MWSDDYTNFEKGQVVQVERAVRPRTDSDHAFLNNYRSKTKEVGPWEN